MANDGECRRVRAFSQLSTLVQTLYPGQEGESAGLLRLVAETAESITRCRVIGMVVPSSWQDIGGHGRGLARGRRADRGSAWRRTRWGAGCRVGVGLPDSGGAWPGRSPGGSRSDHSAHLVVTLSDFLDCAGSSDVAAATLTTRRSTLKYRLKRIRELVADPDSDIVP